MDANTNRLISDWLSNLSTSTRISSRLLNNLLKGALVYAAAGRDTDIIFETYAERFSVFVFVDLELSIHEDLKLCGYNTLFKKRVSPSALGFAGWPPHILTSYACFEVPAEPVAFLQVFQTAEVSSIDDRNEDVDPLSGRPRLAILTITAEFFRFFEGACIARGSLPRALLFKPCMDSALNSEFLDREGKLQSLLRTCTGAANDGILPEDTHGDGKLWVF